VKNDCRAERPEGERVCASYDRTVGEIYFGFDDSKVCVHNRKKVGDDFLFDFRNMPLKGKRFPIAAKEYIFCGIV